jgi:predicted GH43/DUF377 family glycosyl hydrolase
MRNVHYISQTGTSGYANASKGYVYDLIKKGINVKWTTFLCDQSLTAETTEFDGYINKYRNKNIPENEIDTVIIHSTPDIWQKIIEDLKIQCEGKTVIGRTVWEFNKLIPEWVDCINTSQVTEVSVPTKWNKKVFEKSRVNKPIAVDPHLYVDYPYKSYDLKYILENKSTIIYNGDFNKIDFNSAYKFLTIGQLIPRKGITDTIQSFCKTFTDQEDVLILVKTFRLNHSYEEQLKCLEEIMRVIKDSKNPKHPPVIFIKENLTYDEMQSLHDISDCYVQLTKAEGFGLGIFDSYNKNKPVIVTSHGGQLEFLGNDYTGLIDCEIKPINTENKKFFQFDLDGSYTWAQASIDHAGFLMRSKLPSQLELFHKKYNFCFGDGLHELEYENGIAFRWLSDKSEFYIFDESIQSIELELVAGFENQKFSVNGFKVNLIRGVNKIKIYDRVIKTEQSIFVPSNISNIENFDRRKLSVRLYKVTYNYLNGVNEQHSISEINYVDKSIIKLWNKNAVHYVIKNLKNSIFQQQKDVKIVDLPYDDKNFYFNSCLFTNDSTNYLIVRHAKLIGKNKFKNTLKLYELDDSYNVVKDLKLKIIDEVDNEQYEDPRVLFHDNKYYVGCANYQYGNIKYVHQKVLVFDKDFNHIDNIHIEYDGNGKTIEENTIHQKNWTWFIQNNSLMIVYRMNPHVVLEVDLTTKKVVTEYKHFQDISEMWDFGECRMGSNPILKDGYYHNFFHSSLPWKHPKRQYFMGYYKFESVPPFKIVEISKEPILYGNEIDERVLKNISPLVIFPCGAIEKDGKFIVSFGLNDEKTGIIKI